VWRRIRGVVEKAGDRVFPTGKKIDIESTERLSAGRGGEQPGCGLD
jgi:hypothetical protein